MPDISMCLNDKCPLKDNCYRFKAKPNDYQTYSSFKYEWNSESNDWECSHYWPVESYLNSKAE